MRGKLCACTVCPAMIIYLIYAYRKEKRADENAVAKNQHIVDGSYFESPVWHEKYILYKNEHPFERPTCSNMKKDLLLRFKRKRVFCRDVIYVFPYVLCVLPYGAAAAVYGGFWDFFCLECYFVGNSRYS